MIAVIADDFTGAAELGGIGIRKGLSVEIVVPSGPGGAEIRVVTDPGLLVVAADTRSMKAEEATAMMEAITRQVGQLQPEWIYKKTDSVLRGYVVPEIKAHLRALGLKRALVIPANPALGRTIADGHYFLNGVPVHHSAFSIDPEFPITSSDLQDMLRTRQEPVTVKKLSDELPREGIIVGEVATTGDLGAWAVRVDSEDRSAGTSSAGASSAGTSSAGTFLAGASGFFSALLSIRRSVAAVPTVAALRIDAAPVAGSPMVRAKTGSPSLFVSGSTFDRSREAIRKIDSEGGPVSYMPGPEAPFDGWCEEVVGLLVNKGKAIVAIREEDTRPAGWLKEQLATMVQCVLARVQIEELTIEGGATAYAILQKAGLRTFFPVQELAPGVVRMRVQEAPSLYITVKPGSYNWTI
jgi:uncharacterized protein YgbK (DUF1537 family)